MRKLYITLLTLLAACEIPQSGVPAPILEPIESFSVSKIPACRTGYTKGSPKKAPTPDVFLVTLFEFVKSSCSNDTLYGVNSETRDAFSYLSKELGVSKDSSRAYRCAAMFELVRASGAFESDYRWQEGRDKSASNFDFYTMESGLFQTSPNSHYYGHKGYGRWAYLDALVAKHGVGIVKQGSPENEKWNKLMKDESKKHVIIEHHVFMLRHNYRHYGPIIDKANRVGVNLNKACITEVLKFL